MNRYKEPNKSIYMSNPALSKGRYIYETPSPTRSEFQRDRDRIIHCAAFRRLKHKTQVFVYHEGDNYRTRLTHTIEVSQIARALARSLGLNEDLAESLALSHDLGHPPFGHAGEDALQRCLQHYGGFDHNAQGLRIVTYLEKRYALFDGLNLTWETIEGLVKHNGPLQNSEGQPTEPYQKMGIPKDILDISEKWNLELESFGSGEAQAAALADDIAYNAHDLDDGLRAGLFSFEEIKQSFFLKALLDEIDSSYPHLETQRRIYELTRRVITCLVEDVIVESKKRFDALLGVGVQAVRNAGESTVCFSENGSCAVNEMRAFLLNYMYRHPIVWERRVKAEHIVEELFREYSERPQSLPADWHSETENLSDYDKARHIADYIAGMTDQYAVKEYERLFQKFPDL